MGDLAKNLTQVLHPAAPSPQVLPNLKSIMEDLQPTAPTLTLDEDTLCNLEELFRTYNPRWVPYLEIVRHLNSCGANLQVDLRYDDVRVDISQIMDIDYYARVGDILAICIQAIRNYECVEGPPPPYNDGQSGQNPRGFVPVDVHPLQNSFITPQLKRHSTKQREICTPETPPFTCSPILKSPSP